MKKFAILILSVVAGIGAGMLITTCADAAVAIIGSTPIALNNTQSYTAVAGDSVNVSKNGGPVTVYTLTTAMATAGTFNFVDSTSNNCAKDTWVVSYTSLSSGLTSAPAAAVTTTIDGVGCAVKFVPGLLVK